MQGFLFEQEEKINSKFKDLYTEVRQVGKSGKFLHCHVRRYNQLTSMPVSMILKALEDLETIAEGICMVASEIASLKGLEKGNQKHIFLSDIKDKDLRIDTDPYKIKSIFKDLEMGVFRIKYLFRSLSGKSKSPWMISKETDINERYVDLCMGVSRLGIAIKNEIDGI